jgi:hypothetical protein
MCGFDGVEFRRWGGGAFETTEIEVHDAAGTGLLEAPEALGLRRRTVFRKSAKLLHR